MIYQSTGDIILLNSILKEVGKIVTMIIRTHGFVYKYKIPFNELYSEGIVACNKAILKYDPNKRKASGKPTDFFTYTSITAKMSITYHCWYTANKRIKDHTVDISTQYDLQYQQPFYHGSIIDLFRSNYKHLFKGVELEAFNLIATYIETDRVHISKPEIIAAFKKDWHLFKKFDYDKPTSPWVLRLRVTSIFKKIREYEKPSTKKKRKTYTSTIRIKPIDVFHIYTKYPKCTRVGDTIITI